LTHKPTGIIATCQSQRYQDQNRKIATQILRSKLWQLEEEKRQSALDQARREAVGRGMRAEKIRTYNFPQNRVTDHRLNKSFHNLEEILNGNLEKIIKAFQA
jgi:peptide chain release factor 1